MDKSPMKRYTKLRSGIKYLYKFSYAVDEVCSTYVQQGKSTRFLTL